MTKRAKVTIYKANDGWRWSFSRNGRIRADGGQGYTRHIDCAKGMRDVLNIRSRGANSVYRTGADGNEEVIRLVDEGKP